VQIEIAGLSKRFGTTPVLDRIDLTVTEHEFLGLLGPSGSGKTTLLRILAGLEFANNGNLRFDGRDAQALPIEQRQVGLVFQHYALFGHMTVFNNIAFGLQVRPRATRPSRRDIAARVEGLLKLVQLDDMGSRFPRQLSGGQRQRVALARALATEPKLLLLDEVLTGLTPIEAQTGVELVRKVRATGVTVLMVEHVMEIVMPLVDRAIVLDLGKVLVEGKPNDVVRDPKVITAYLGDRHAVGA
jgi:branched-chain amino acid transport system ATP-binding protein